MIIRPRAVSLIAGVVVISGEGMTLAQPQFAAIPSRICGSSARQPFSRANGVVATRRHSWLPHSISGIVAPEIGLGYSR